MPRFVHLIIALTLSTAVAFAPASPSRPLARIGAPTSRARAPPGPIALAAAPAALPPALADPAWNACVAVQGAWFAVYYLYMFLSASVPKDGSDAQRTWATRCFMNMGEQAPAFLPAFWSHAAFASPARAAACGAAYVLTRVLYGIQRFHLKGGMTPLAGFGSTIPGYVINVYLLGTVVARRCFGKAIGASPWSILGFVPVPIVIFILSGKFNQAVKSHFD